MIEWAKNKALQLEKNYLRLDTGPQRKHLCAFYESLGFVKVKEDLYDNHIWYEMILN